MSHLLPPSLEDIKNAARRIEGFAVKTPLLESHPLSEKLGARVFIKPECLQRVGAFKFRGAFNRLSQLSDEEKKRGVVAFSSGNHAQGVAAAAKILGIKATIVMPFDAPEMKRKNTLGFGARVVGYDREHEDREQVAAKVVGDSGAIMVPPFEDVDIIAGQGTAALEVIEQAQERGIVFDQFLCPVGGGGLMSGCSTAFKALSEHTELFGVEPEGFDDVARSLTLGELQKNETQTGSICDALMTQSAGALTYKIIKQNVSAILTVSDAEVLAAIKYAWEKLKLVVEPGGAVGLAAVLSDTLDVKGKTVCILISGGNVDEATFERALHS